MPKIIENKWLTYEMIIYKYNSENEIDEHAKELSRAGWSIYGKVDSLTVSYRRPIREASLYRNKNLSKEQEFKKYIIKSTYGDKEAERLLNIIDVDVLFIEITDSIIHEAFVKKFGENYADNYK